jgi:transcription elongation factor GreA-like protein/transcription elongation GreA/GreB family factor
MGYLKEFLTQINNRDFHKFLVLWEEYCTSDTVESEEFSQLLKAIKASDMAKHFGQITETALPLWRTIQNPAESYDILRLLMDLQTTNSQALAEVMNETLEKTHGSKPKFNEHYRLAGLRNKDNFQGGLSKYDLVAHMVKNNVVFHTGGWGTGEIMEISFIREHLVIEFENVAGKKDLSFANAFKTLIPLPNEHFLARRFANPDLLEKEGREDPVKLIKLLLHDIGPRNAVEIKDELCELVIPEKEWTKWWQGARAKIKKDPIIETPDSIREPFYLRKAELSNEQRLEQAMHNKTDANQIIQTTYSFVRDTPTALKNSETKESLQAQLIKLLDTPELSEDQKLQIYLLLEQFFNYKAFDSSLIRLIQSHDHIENIIQAMDIVAFKKRALLSVKEHRSDWPQVFMNSLFSLPQTQLRDFILKELNQPAYRVSLEKNLKELLDHPARHPDVFVWYFQKLIVQNDKDIPFHTAEGRWQFFESFFILFRILENQSGYRELVKKMYNLLSTGRYALVRQMFQGASLEAIKEFLLLASKCQNLSDLDMKIFRSLAEVVYPELTPPKHSKGARDSQEEVWSTETSYLRIQDRIRQIGTVDMVENAREIEAARALGDLRENSEFKFAQERRARLQSELKTLSDQFGRARLITPEDVHHDEIGTGSVVELVNEQDKTIRYTILGSWDANPEENILSLNSKLAQAMLGKKKGEQFTFKDETFTVKSLSSYFNS